MGVAGAGKTTIGKELAAALHAEFLDADSLHSPANIAKMSAGISLNDADRAPWLAAVHDRILQAASGQKGLVVACSALKQKYRDLLGSGVEIIWVYLKASRNLIQTRLAKRKHHFMKANLLASQFRDLEVPRDAIVVDAELQPAAAVRQIMEALPSRMRAD